MPRINTYPPDVILQNEDLILGSDYKGTVNGIPIYETKSFSLNSLGNYLSRFVYVNPNIYDLARYDSFTSYAGEYDADGNLISLSTAFADQVLSVTTSDRYANAQFVTNLATSVGVFNPDGTLSSLSEAFANQVLSTTSSERFATSLFATNLASSVGVYDENGVITSLSEAFANQVLTTTTSDKFATSQFATNLASSFGTYNPDGSIASFSESFADQVLSTANTSEFAQAQFVTNLASSLGTTDAEGNLTVSEAFANQVLNTETTTDYAQAQFVTNLASSLGTTDAEGNLTISEAFANQVLETETTTDYAQAQFVTNLASSLGTTDAEGNLTVSEAFANQVLNTETTTDYAQAQFVTNLASSLGTTDAEGNLTVSEAFANQVLNTETTTDYAQAQFVTNLASSLGTTDAEGNLTVSEAFANQVLETETTSDFASALSVNQLETAVGNIPLIYRQDDPPSLTETPIGSLWFDTNDNNKGYILVAGDPNVWTIVEDTEFTAFKADYEEIINTAASTSGANATKLTNLNATLDILNADGTVKKTTADFFEDIRADVDANSATASKAETLRVNLEGEDGNGGLTASVSTNSEAVGNINGKLTASYGVHVNAGGKIAGLKLLADSTTTSSFIAQADEFGVDMPNGTRVLTVDSNGLLINGSGTFTGDFNAGLVEIRSNTIKLKATPSYGSTGDIEFYNQAGVLFGAIRSRSINVGGTDHDAITIGSPFAGALDTVVIDGQSIIANPADYDAFETGQGGVQFGNFVTPWETVGVSASQSISLRTGDSGVLVDPPNSIFMNNGGPGVIWTSISSEGYVSISSAGAIYLNPGESSGVFINGVEIGTGGTTTDTTRSDEEIRDVIASFITAGNNVTVSHDDAGNTLTINSSYTDTNTQRSDEEIRDVIAPFIVGGTYISVSHDDAANTLTVSHSDTSSQASVNNSNGTVIQDVTLDSRGHVTGLGSVNLDNRYLRSGVSGTVNGTITATDFIIASDQRIKHDISTYDPGTVNINFRSYRLNSSPDRLRYGVIAQELERDHPEMVITNPETGMKAVSYVDMLVAKVAELEKRIKQLENGGS